MRYQQIVSLILGVLIFAASAQAQTGNWQAVMNLPPGAYLAVKTDYQFACIFRSATDDELICGRTGPRGASSELRIDRRTVREVRFEHLDHGNPLIGAAIGGGIGVAAGIRAGAAGGARSSAGLALIFGTAIGGFGALIAYATPIFHRKVIYRQ